MAMVLGSTATDSHLQGQRPYLLISVPLVPTTEPGTEQDSVFVERISKCLSIYKHFLYTVGKWFHPVLQAFWIIT